MLTMLEGYFAQLHSVVQGARDFVQQNEFNLVLVAGVVGLLIFVTWLNGVWKRIQTGRELRNSEVIAYQLERIAGALERLSRMQRSGIELSRSVAPASEPVESAAVEAPRTAGVGSMFGFSSGMTLPNPMYRPR